MSGGETDLSGRVPVRPVAVVGRAGFDGEERRDLGGLAPVLRHQLAVAQRRDSRLARKLTWADRAWLVLLAGLLPHGRLPRVRLIVTPGMVLRWHRNLLRRRWARRSRLRGSKTLS